MATTALYAGWAITVAIAVGGWLVNQEQARRATRRNMRIDSLLDAYRRLDRASNRPLTTTTAQDIEAAVTDMMLLGTPAQASLAHQFARTFTADRAAEARPLLIDLRDSLRREARLEHLPPTYTSLRITMRGDSVSDHARIWRETSQTTRHSLDTELASQDIPATPAGALATELITEMAELGNAASPGAAIAASHQRVEHAMRELLAGATTEDFTALNLTQLASRALQLKLIDPRLADTLNGLSVMRALAATNRDRINSAQAAEFSSIATTALYLLDIANRRPQVHMEGEEQHHSPPLGQLLAHLDVLRASSPS